MLDVLQDRVAELKERAKLQETPIQMQVKMMANGNKGLMNLGFTTHTSCCMQLYQVLLRKCITSIKMG